MLDDTEASVSQSRTLLDDTVWSVSQSRKVSQEAEWSVSQSRKLSQEADEGAVPPPAAASEGRTEPPDLAP